MSQFFVGAASSVLPPTIATSYPTDYANDDDVITSPGLAIPEANQLFVIGNSAEFYTTSGIATIAVPNMQENLEISLTNRIVSNNATFDPTQTVQLVSFQMTVSGTYSFDSTISAYNNTDVLGASYSVFCGVRFTSPNGFKLGTEDKIVNVEAGMETCQVIASISGDTFIISVTGIAGKTIRWNGVTTYQRQEA